MRRLTLLAIAAGLLLAVVAPMASAAGKPPKPPKPPKENDTQVQLLAINDFHGNLAANTPGTIQVGCCNAVNNSAGVQTGWAQKTVVAGGIEYLATHIKSLRATNANTITVGAGDLIGASPLVSALFHDEPTIEAMNSIGLDVTGVGNHEFDEGIDELRRMQFGNQLGGDGCHPVDGCLDGTPFLGAIFQYLAANVVYTGTDETIFPPYEVRKIGNAKLAFIGLTLEGTPTIVTPSGVAGLDFKPEVATVNALVPSSARSRACRRSSSSSIRAASRIRRRRLRSRRSQPRRVHRREQVRQLQRARDHRDRQRHRSTGEGRSSAPTPTSRTSVHIGGKLVTSAASFGRLVTDIDLTIDHQSKEITEATATNVIVTRASPRILQPPRS